VVQDDVVLENFAIPEKYFSCPIEELFDLLGKTFADFAVRMKRSVFSSCLHALPVAPCSWSRLSIASSLHCPACSSAFREILRAIL